MEISINPDASEVFSKKKLYFNIIFKSIKNIDTTKPIAMSGILDYNSSILSNPTINGGTNWSAGLYNNKILLDAMSFKEGESIATITFDFNYSENSNISTKIALTSVEISNSENFDVTAQRIESGEAIISFVQQSTSETNQNEAELNIINLQ